MADTTRSVCTELASLLSAHGWVLATAESCTGGQIAAACTDLGGSSTWFDRGFVTYSNEAKCEMLAVDANLIARHGAVSQQVAQALATGALEHSNAQVSVAVTGIAGPTGGSDAKPVGTVWFAWATPAGTHSECVRFAGDRAAVRNAATLHALTVLRDRIQNITA
jgi:nicotinamide-nucleotide amidase